MEVAVLGAKVAHVGGQAAVVKVVPAARLALARSCRPLCKTIWDLLMNSDRIWPNFSARLTSGSPRF